MSGNCGLSAAKGTTINTPARLRIQIADGSAFLHCLRRPIGAVNQIERRIADAEPIFLTDEMMAQMVLFHPAAEARSRHIGDVSDIVHPFIMRDAKHHAENDRRSAGSPEYERYEPAVDRQDGKQKPQGQKKKIEPVRLGVVIVVQTVLHPAQPSPWRRFGVKRKTVERIFA